jgi:hypothetical protein
MDPHPRPPERGQDAHLGRPDERARPQHDLAALLVLPRATRIVRPLDGAEDAHLALGGGRSGRRAGAPAAEPFPVRVLVRHDRVRARGDGGPGEDAVALAGAYRSGGHLAGGDLAQQAQRRRMLGRGPGDVLRPHGVAVHRRVVERRHVDVGRDVLDRHPPQGVQEGDALVLPERRKSGDHPLESVVHREHVRRGPAEARRRQRAGQGVHGSIVGRFV